MTRLLSLVLLLAAFTQAQQPHQTLYACMTSTKDYYVGAKLSPSGLFVKASNGEWQHKGYNHPFLTGLDYDPADPSTLYVSAGNALIRMTDHGQNWKFLTGSDITELRDVALDRNAPGTIYFAYCHGIRVSHDRGTTWQEIGSSLHRKYTEAIRVDRRKAGVLLAGGEEGIFRSEDAGKTWRIAGAAGFQVMRIEQSPHDPCQWLAATQQGGLFGSKDCGQTFENVGRIGVDRNLYDIAYDPNEPKRIAVAGWGPGVVVSEDGGLTWQARNIGLPRPDVVSVVFDPENRGRLYAAINEDALYVSNDAGKTWTRDGLDASVVSRMRFIPESPAK
ncbi:MAG TPA: hypothetical protein VGL72_29095 [Bryobacteraceae bacterium]|jgi:photosystem II stability/assembly factor-like uncharacterized protein